MNKEKKLKIVGIDIGGTMIKYGLISLTGEILASGARKLYIKY